MDKLSYVFELDGQTHGFEVAVDKMAKADTTINHVDRKIQMLQAHLRELKAPGQILRMEREIANFGKLDGAVDKTHGKFHEFFSFLGAEVAFEGVKKLTEMVIDLGKEALTAAGKAERMDLSFELTLGQEGAKDVLEWIEQIAGKTEYTDDQLKAWGLQLANAGLKGEKLKDNMAAILDVAAKRGAGGADVAVDALSRANLSGKIEGRALRGLGIPVADLAQLHQFAGMNEKQINKALESDATVSKDDLLKLIAGPDKMLGDKGLRASQTFEARMMHLKDLPDQFFQKLSKTDAFNKLNDSIGKTLSKLDPDSPTGKKIFGALESTFDAFATAVDKIDFNAMADTITDEVLPAIKAMTSLIVPTIDAIERVLRGLHMLKNVVDSNADFGADVKTNAQFADRQRFVEDRARKAALDAAGSKKELDVGPGAKAWHGKFQLVGEAAADGMAEGLNAGIDKVDAASRGMVKKGAIEPARDEAGAHSPATKFIELGKDIGDGFTIGFQRQQSAIADMMSGTFAPPAAVPPARIGGGAQVSLEVNVNVIGTGDPTADGEAAGAAVVSAIRAPLVQILEEYDKEGG